MFSASRQTNQSPFTPCFYLITSPRAKGLLQRPFWPSDTWQHYIIRISCSTGIQGTQFCQPQYLKESTRWKYPCLPLDQRFKKMRGGGGGRKNNTAHHKHTTTIWRKTFFSSTSTNQLQNAWWSFPDARDVCLKTRLPYVYSSSCDSCSRQRGPLHCAHFHEPANTLSSSQRNFPTTKELSNVSKRLIRS